MCPHFNLEWLHKSFVYIACSLWNKLPIEIRQLDDIKSFKNALYVLELNSVVNIYYVVNMFRLYNFNLTFAFLRVFLAPL